MAKCEKRVVRPEPPPVEYVLTLTLREAQALRKLIGETSGLATERMSIFEALGNAGLSGAGFRVSFLDYAVRLDYDA